MIWIDAHLSPSLAKWITDTFDVPAQAARDVGLREAKDFPIFQSRAQGKRYDSDKRCRFTSPPHLAWSTP